MQTAYDIYDFLWEYQVFVAVFLALIVVVGFRISSLAKWVRRKLKKSENEEIVDS